MAFRPFKKKKDGKQGPRRKKQDLAMAREPGGTRCRFCRDRAGDVDYKDVDTLAKMITTQGKMYSRKRSGNCTAHQRSMEAAMKHARYMALIPYIGWRA